MSAQLKVVEIVRYKPGNAPRRVATIRLEDGRYLDLIEDDDGQRNYDASVSFRLKEVFCFGQSVPGDKILISGPQSELSGI